MEIDEKFREYLLSVQERVTEDYPEISDLINRYKTLRGGHAGLTRKQIRNEDKNEERRAEYLRESKVNYFIFALSVKVIITFVLVCTCARKKTIKFSIAILRLQIYSKD